MEWKCTNLDKCETARKKIKTERPEICSFRGFNVIVCCEPKSSSTSFSQSTERPTSITPQNQPDILVPPRDKPAQMKSEQSKFLICV